MRHWRKMTWVLWAWTALAALWIGVGFTAENPSSCHGLSHSACTAATNVGEGIGVFVIVIVWLIGFLFLSLIWFMTRPKGRVCPRCGENVRKGQTKCGKCGYDYAATLPAGGAPSG